MFSSTNLGRSGFARFTNARFTMRKEDIANTFIHLTNVAIQKHAPGFDASKGMKWSIRSLRTHMTTRHGAEATHELFHNIQVGAQGWWTVVEFWAFACSQAWVHQATHEAFHKTSRWDVG